MSDVQLHQSFLEHMAIHDGLIPVFTDGSKSSAGKGFGVVSSNFEVSERLSNDASIFTAELLGILTAVKEVLKCRADN